MPKNLEMSIIQRLLTTLGPRFKMTRRGQTVRNDDDETDEREEIVRCVGKRRGRSRGHRPLHSSIRHQDERTPLINPSK